jgi:hypothetical protein
MLRVDALLVLLLLLPQHAALAVAFAGAYCSVTAEH